MTKLDKEYLKKLESLIEKANANLKYSIDRFDILIISISSGGLVFSMSFVKDLLLEKKNIDFLQLKISWILFSTAIIINLLSQISAYYANKYDIKVTRNIINEEIGKPIFGNQCKLELLQNVMNNITVIFNAISLLSLIAAILFLVFFMSINL